MNSSIIFMTLAFWIINHFICRRGLTDELGAEAMMMNALDKVEKEIGKPLMRNDKNSMSLLTAEFDKINKKYAFISNFNNHDILFTIVFF